MDIRLLASLSTTCMYAAAAFERNPTSAAGAPGGILHDPIVHFLHQAQASDAEVSQLMQHLVPLSAQIDSVPLLAETALAKAIGRQRAATSARDLAEALRELQQACRDALPDLMQQLELRGPVIREQWEARGPGLLLGIRRLTDEALLAEQADVVLVQPFLGGGGDAYLPYNTVVLEAVLANPHVDLPEVARLGWLLSQLNLEAPIWSETIPPGRLRHVAALAMLPITLAAAEKVELAQCAPASVQRAIEVWHIDVADQQGTAETVWSWWNVYAQSRPKLPVALAALDRMLNESA